MGGLLALAVVLGGCVSGNTVERDPANTPVEGGSEIEQLTPAPSPVTEARTVAAVQDDNESDPVLPTSEEPAVTIDDITYNTDIYLAKTVQVFAEVSDVVNNQVFYANDPGEVGGGMLVVAPEAETETFQTGDIVVVQGVVRVFDTAEMGSELSEAIPEDMAVSLDDQVILLAQNISQE
jgi:hypothetical protein